VRCEIAALGVRTGSSTAPEQGFRILHRTVGFFSRGITFPSSPYRTSCSRTRRLPPSSIAISEPAFQAKLNHGYILCFFSFNSVFLQPHYSIPLNKHPFCMVTPASQEEKKKAQTALSGITRSLSYDRIVPKSSSHPVSRNHGGGRR
jgi:hypothetical protein